MQTKHVKSFPLSPFSVECNAVKNQPGTWDSTKVSIYRDDYLIGEYLRNYSSHGTNTFYPFKIADVWYALYSAHYTATRVMRLNEKDIEDWCGESESPYGFCPVEFYIPQYAKCITSVTINGSSTNHEYFMVDNDEEFLSKGKDVISTEYCTFGFLSGCVWGDDSSWKLRYIDLSSVPDKVLSITDKFGYWELPNTLKLKQCIDMGNWEPTHQWINLTRMEHVNVETGQRC